MARMKPKMVLDKTGDEEIAVVVAFLHPQFKRDIAPNTNLFKQIGLELTRQELVLCPLVDKERRPAPPAVFDQRRRIVFAPSCTIACEIASESFFAPWTTHRRAYRGKSRDRLVSAGMLERDRERAMPTHGMTEDSGARRIDRKALSDDVGQLLGDIRIHAVAMRPWLLSRVDIETGAKSEIVAFALAWNTESPRAGIRHDDYQPELGGNSLRPRFDDEVLLRAGKAREPIQHWHRACVRLRRNKHPEAHDAPRLLRAVAIPPLNPAEAKILGDSVDRRLRHASLHGRWRASSPPPRRGSPRPARGPGPA